MTEGDKILLAAVTTMLTVIGAVLKQGQLIQYLINRLGKAITESMVKSSKWECKYRPPENQPDGKKESGGTN